MNRIWYVLVLCAVLCSPRALWASGSVSVTVVEKHCSVQIEQAFRKIMSHGMPQGYATGVQKDFLSLAAGVAPAVEQFVRTRAKKKIPSLGRWQFLSRVFKCRRVPCRLQQNFFPAIVVLTNLSSQRNARHLFHVGLPFRQRPTSKELQWLRTSLTAVLQKVGERRRPKVTWVKAKAYSHDSPSVRLRVNPLFYTRAALSSWYLAYQRKMIKVFKRFALPVVRRSKGVTLARFGKTPLPSFDPQKGGVGKIQVYEGVVFHWAVVMVAIRKVKDQQALTAFRSELTRALLKLREVTKL